ncbi:MAG: hypothetical protein CBC91_00110 [Rickettsiales bacterium TMED131]|nr:MAG: hypothetical protein CBC91_06980 [Rickettsiales bacterium TMED131]OUV83945.1 MAG: hypothetical protein CBC91_00110 [Rickettsiales bacterium TMED131]|tara:strand:- start:1799 stop:2047 length:249 start_codon:yes stop_codon:yes gene_type:complete
MGLETHSKVEIHERYHKEGLTPPTISWTNGTMYIDTNDQKDLDIIKDVMLSEVLSPGYKLDFNCLKATETEPWDQWAMDIYK